MSETEQRSAIRYPWRIPVSVVLGGKPVVVYTADVSLRGVFLRTDTPPPLRQLVQLRMPLPPGNREVLVHAMAVHVDAKDSEDGTVPGAGMQFFAVDRETDARWTAFIGWVRSQLERGAASVPPEPMPVQEPLRREHARVPVEIEIEIPFERSAIAACAQNVSLGGMFLGTDAPLELGDTLHINVLHPVRDEEFTVRATVVRASDDVNNPGFGVRFDGMDDEGRLAFREFLRDGLPSNFLSVFDPTSVVPPPGSTPPPSAPPMPSATPSRPPTSSPPPVPSAPPSRPPAPESASVPPSPPHNAETPASQPPPELETDPEPHDIDDVTAEDAAPADDGSPAPLTDDGPRAPTESDAARDPEPGSTGTEPSETPAEPEPRAESETVAQDETRTSSRPDPRPSDRPSSRPVIDTEIVIDDD